MAYYFVAGVGKTGWIKAMTTPREKYERRKQTFTEYVEAGEIDPDTAEAIRELLNAYDDENLMHSAPAGESSREASTLTAWCYTLMTFGRRLDLTEATPEQLKTEFQKMVDGSHPQVKDEGLAKSTVINYQASARNFYRYHDFGVEPEEIPIFSQESTPVDPEDMLDRDEIQQVRDAIGNPRNRAIFELLLNTGQRREAIRTLRLKDIDLAEGRYRLNPNVEGLKGATKRNGYRPLLGAKGPLRNWLEYHPAADEPEAYVITQRPSWSAVEPHEPVSGETIRKVMQNIKGEAGIEKPMHPHMMRHNFVTMAKRDYEMADDTIKYLIGHSEASTVMESTYSHLSDADYIKKAEESFGIREPDDESPLTPEACQVCGEPLQKNAKACPRCGTVYTPDAKAAKDDIDEALWNDMQDADDPEDTEALDQLRQLLKQNPELVQEVMKES